MPSLAEPTDLSVITSTDSYEFRRRVDLIRRNIYGNFLSSGDGYHLSFDRVINRLCILVQLPVCFVLYEKINGHYQRSNKIFAKDPFFHDKLFNNACLISYREDQLTPAAKNTHGDIFQVFGTQYYLMAFNVENDISPINNEFSFLKISLNSDFHGNTISSNNEYMYFSIRDVLSSEWNFLEKKYKLSDDFKKYVTTSIEHICNFEKNDNDRKVKIIDNDENYLDEDEIFCKIYDRFRSSVNLLNKMKITNNHTDDLCNRAPNILIYYRDYNRKERKKYRFDKYPYNVKLLNSSSQKNDILAFFKNMIESRSIPDNSKKSISYNDNHYLHYFNESISEFQYKKAYKAHDIFSKILKGEEYINIHLADDKKERYLTGADAIVEILGRKFGDNSASFADSVFNNGTIYFREILKYGGINRVKSNDTKNSASDNLIDRIRLIASHYLLSSMCSPSCMLEKDEHLSMMLLPMQAGGSIWGVLGHVIKIKREKSYLDNHEWNRTYLFFDSIAIPVEKEIRKNLRDSYINDIFNKEYTMREEYFINNLNFNSNLLSFSSAIGKMMLKDKNDAERILKRVNHKISNLTKIYPYSMVEFSLKNNNKEQTSNFLLNYNIDIKTTNSKISFDFDSIIRNHVTDKFIGDINDKISIRSKQAFGDLMLREKYEKED